MSSSSSYELLPFFVRQTIAKTRYESSARDASRLMKGSAMKKATGKKFRGPSRASLREMPEVNFDKAKVRRNPYALRIAAEEVSIHVGRGRPRKGTETGPTLPRSVRFPARVWRHLERRARAEGIPLHAALRAAVMAWINKATDRPSNLDRS